MQLPLNLFFESRQAQGAPALHVLRVWRKPADNKPVLDGQGSARVYLEEAKQDAAAGKALPAVTLYAAEMKVEGKSCK